MKFPIQGLSHLPILSPSPRQSLRIKVTSQATDQRLGKLAYEAYMMQLGDLSEPWDGLTGTFQNAWIAAARTIEAQAYERANLDD